MVWYFTIVWSHRPRLDWPTPTFWWKFWFRSPTGVHSVHLMISFRSLKGGRHLNSQGQKDGFWAVTRQSRQSLDPSDREVWGPAPASICDATASSVEEQGVEIPFNGKADGFLVSYGVFSLGLGQSIGISVGLNGVPWSYLQTSLRTTNSSRPCETSLSLGLGVLIQVWWETRVKSNVLNVQAWKQQNWSTKTQADSQWWQLQEVA